MTIFHKYHLGLAFALAAGIASPGIAAAKDIKSIAVTVSSLSNPFYHAVNRGVEDAAKEHGGDIKTTVISAEYDLAKQSSQIDSFIASGVDLIVIAAVDRDAIAPAIARARAAGVLVVGSVDITDATDANVTTDNVQAGKLACQAIVDKLGGKGKMIILNGPPVSALLERQQGCHEVLARNTGVELLSEDQNAHCSRDEGFSLMSNLLVRYPDTDAVFSLCDPQTLGASLAVAQTPGSKAFLTSVDGAPDALAAIKSGGNIYATVAQDPYYLGHRAVEIGMALAKGETVNPKTERVAPKLVSPANVDTHKGWDGN